MLKQYGECGVAVEASLIRNDSVFTRDGKNIGTIVNVIVKCDSAYPVASLLVFPHEKNWLGNYIKENWGKITIDTIKQAFPAEAPKILDDVKNKGAEEAEKVWKAYLNDNIEKAQMALKKCYLIPSLLVDEPKRKKEKLFLKADLEHIEAKYCSIGEPPVSEDEDMAFFATHNKPMRDQDSLLPITLNLEAMQRLEVRDCQGERGWVDDIQLDFKVGKIANIVVQNIGEDPGNRLINPGDFNFDKFTSKSTFTSYPKLSIL